MFWMGMVQPYTNHPQMSAGFPKERFPVGSRVRVASEALLLDFIANWKYHRPLQKDQLKYAGLASIVSDVGFYHGGDILYQLKDTGNSIWHESCLLPG